MAKRIAVKSTGKGNYSGLNGLPKGTEFKAVEFKLATNPDMQCVYIRGSSLAKATGKKDIFIHKQYCFVLGYDNSSMELA